MRQFGAGRRTRPTGRSWRISRRGSGPWRSAAGKAGAGPRERALLGLRWRAHEAQGRSGLHTLRHCAPGCARWRPSQENPKETDAERCITWYAVHDGLPVHARALNPVMLMGVTQKLKKACEGRKGNAFFS